MARVAKNHKALSSSRRPTLKELKARRVRSRRAFLIKAYAPVLVVLLASAYIARQRRNRLQPSRTVRSASAIADWAPVYGVSVKRDIPHDIHAFTQGLAWCDGFLYESTGLFGRSSLRQIAPISGEIVDMRQNTREEFAEGVALGDAAGKELIQMLWKVGKGHVLARDGLARKSTFKIEGDAWGLAADTGRLFYLSDGSSRIRVYRRTNDGLELVRSFVVRDGGKEVRLLNELEVIEGELWANIWYSDLIARIDLNSGIVRSWVHCRDLLKEEHVPEGHTSDVLNGIAYSSQQKRIFVTGKLWSRIFEIEVTKDLVASSVRYLNPFFMDKEKVEEIMRTTE